MDSVVLTPVIEYPMLSARIQSSFIDLLVVIAAMFGISALLDRCHNVPDWVAVLLFVAVFIAYEPVCTALGGTLGNLIKGIRVRRESDPARRIGLIAAIFRYAVKLLLGWLSFLTINTNPQKRALHDFAGGSVMIRV